MQREMMQAKLHRATVSATRHDYAGSLSVDPELMERAGLIEHQKVHVANLNNGARLDTYLISGASGAHEITVNGAAARHAEVGDRVIIIAYSLYDEVEAKGHKPIVLVLNELNQVIASL